MQPSFPWSKQYTSIGLSVWTKQFPGSIVVSISASVDRKSTNMCNPNALTLSWMNLKQGFHRFSLHCWHRIVAITCSLFCLQESHKTSVCFWYDSDIANSWWFIGSCSAHALADIFLAGEGMTSRHTGQSNDIVFFFLTQFVIDESINDCIHNSQNVCRHGKYFGFFNVSKQIGQSKTLPSLPEAAISIPRTQVNLFPEELVPGDMDARSYSDTISLRELKLNRVVTYI